MKRIFALSLIILLLAPYGVKIGVWAWYFQNKAYITAELCENRDRPELACEGKCVLNKALQKADCCAQEEWNESSSDNQKTNPVAPLKKALEAFGFDYIPNHSALDWEQCPNTTAKVFHPYFNELTDQISAKGIFHPPC